MRSPSDEEHVLPAVEAVLAGTLALMTGYGQALQAALHPEQRLLMGAKIVRNLELLADHPMLSEPFHTVLENLRERWQSMTACTCEAVDDTRAASSTCVMPQPALLQ